MNPEPLREGSAAWTNLQGEGETERERAAVALVFGPHANRERERDTQQSCRRRDQVRLSRMTEGDRALG